ncbi:MAG: transposase, partial [Gloeomargarita sp. SKYG116]|nr:transposase [Gloeomargarita sp. SKYG116]MDW8402408.1 transposase [Gloeomargarita sp. SKYGB_i_bin116]
HLLHLLTQLLAHYRRPEPAHTTFALALAELLQPARHTIAQLWSLLGFCTFPARAYRLFQRYFDPDRAFRLLFEQMLSSLPADEPLLLVLDSTQVPRTGKRMPGVGLLRAGNTVPFAKGLHKAQRWVGAFTLTPAEYGYRRAIVVSWEPAFPARTTPAPEGAQASEVQRGLELVHRVRAWMDACGRSEQPLVVLGDGAYSAQAFVQGLPARTWAIVRVRADARLCALPEGGRRRVYGARFAPRDIWRARRGQAVPVAGRW